MASTFLFASLLVFLLLKPGAPSSVSELLSPLLSPVFDDVCKEVNCGKGTCKPSSSAFFFECECQPGWKQTASGSGDDFKFLPCVIPNCKYWVYNPTISSSIEVLRILCNCFNVCSNGSLDFIGTMNYSCSKAPSAVQDKASKSNDSVFNPCYLSYCGGGSCNATSQFTHDCVCPAGYNNLLNISTFPCFQSCEIGMDCTNLGISPSNQSSTPATAENASSITQGHSLWLILTMVFMSIVLSGRNW